jgi:hypothetical protein
MVALSGFYRGKGKYQDIWYNLQRMRKIYCGYWDWGMFAIPLPLLTESLGSIPHTDVRTHERAMAYCRDVISRCDRLDIYYPASEGLSEGQEIEKHFAEALEIPVKEFPQERW